MAYSYWMSFFGNVLGAPGQMGGWVYETTFGGKRGIWMLGWDDQAPYRVDAKVSATTLRHGNFDYVTNTVISDPTLPIHTLPELPLPSPETGLLQRRERVHLAMGGPGGSDQALHAAGQGSLRRRDAVHAALKTRSPTISTAASDSAWRDTSGNTAVWLDAPWCIDMNRIVRWVEPLIPKLRTGILTHVAQCCAGPIASKTRIKSKGLDGCDKLASTPQVGRGQRELVLSG